jgi:NAD(P)-dependent dehydrogenase (short-subunit alcohol dehydrogenase family)
MPELAGQTAVVIGGSAGSGLETARRARAEGADVVLAARDPERLREAANELDALVEAHLLLPIQVARESVGRGSAMTKNLAVEVAPIRVNMIAAGFVDTGLSATLLRDQLDARREQLLATLPIQPFPTFSEIYNAALKSLRANVADARVGR